MRANPADARVIDGPANEPVVPPAVAASIERWKQALLDLSKRNRALNFRAFRVSTITVVDEQPPEVLRRLHVDRVPAPLVAAGICAICAAGCAVLLVAGPAGAPFAAVAIGAAMGGEIDLIGFLVARHFPLTAFGRIYGVQYAGFILIMRLVDFFYLISPNPRISTNGTSLPLSLSFSWMDIAAPIAVGGIWLWYFFGQLAKRPLVPVMDPFLENAIEHGRGH